jgi:polygalacturonase
MVALTLGIFFTSLAASAVAAPAPAITPAPKPEVVKRASSCTFSGSTLDLSSLADGTTVIFEGTTTWGYSEWKGPLLDIQGKKITVKGAEGSVLNGDGARWWDGKGGNGGKTKPKFFSAHKLTDSTITGITIKNPPVQVVSINGCDGLTITDMTIDASDGDKDEQGHNTDGFDIGSSNNVIIDGAKVYNQDDCVAVNSGTVSNDMKLRYSHLLTSRLGNHLQERPLLRWTRSIHWLGWWS